MFVLFQNMFFLWFPIWYICVQHSPQVTAEDQMLKVVLLVIIISILGVFIFMQLPPEGPPGTVRLYVRKGNTEVRLLNESMDSGKPVRIGVHANNHGYRTEYEPISNMYPIRSVFFADDENQDFEQVLGTRTFTKGYSLKTQKRYYQDYSFPYRIMEATVVSSDPETYKDIIVYHIRVSEDLTN